MSKEMDDITRFNELRLRELVIRFIKEYHSIKPLQDFIKLIDPEINMIAFQTLLLEITTVKYEPSEKEIMYLHHQNGRTLKELAELFNITHGTLLNKGVKYFTNVAVCPRSNEIEAELLNNFFKKYDKIFTKELSKNG